MQKSPHQRHLGDSVSKASDFGSGHDLTVCEFEPHVRLCADSSEPGACFGFRVSSLYPSLLMLCLSKMNKCLKNKLAHQKGIQNVSWLDSR